MFDLVIEGGLIVDGTGAPGWIGDVGIADGRIASLGEGGPARRRIGAEGLVVAPGFIDLHTHYDVQAFWDPTLSPSPLHGVTTVIGGNCGFSVAPLAPGTVDYVRRMLAEVEGMPLSSLEGGVPWDWSSTAEYLDRLEGRLGPNAGFLVGHSALRAAVLPPDELHRQARPAEMEEMKRLLLAGIEAGALGFSSTTSPTHNDHLGDPVPSRGASAEELIELCSVLRGTAATAIEFIPDVVPFGGGAAELMAAMSAAADRPLNWNVLQVYADNGDVVEQHLATGGRADGAHVVALTLPTNVRVLTGFRPGLLSALPGWAPFLVLDVEDRMAQLADPIRRAELDHLAQSDPAIGQRADWAAYTVVQVGDPALAHVSGTTIAELAGQAGTSPWEALVDLVLRDRLRTVLCRLRDNPDEAWRRRIAVWRDRERAVVGASDAGAHLDAIDTFSYGTTMLAEAVGRGLLPLEEAVSLLTDAPARLYGLAGRGRLAVGHHADVVVFDPSIVGPGTVEVRADLPGGAERLYSVATGIHRVLVGGVELAVDGELTDARPGSVLRSGRDTNPVTASG